VFSWQLETGLVKEYLHSEILEVLQSGLIAPTMVVVKHVPQCFS
jgi:hypothetical protein